MGSSNAFRQDVTRLCLAVFVAISGLMVGAALGQNPYAAPATSQRVFTLQHRAVGDLLPQVKLMVGDNSAEIFVVPERNELVVRGGEASLALAQQIIQKLDRPPVGGQPELHAYDVSPEKQATALAWRDAFRGAEGERAAWDARTGQLILLASPAVHAQVQQLLAGAGSTAAGTPRVVKLTKLSPEQLHERVQGLVNQPLPATWDGTRRWLSFPVRLGAKGGVTLQVDAPAHEVHFSGPPSEVEAWSRVVRALDTRDQSGEATELIATQGARLPAVRRALSAIQNSSEGRRVVAQLASQPIQNEQEATEDAMEEDPATTLPGRATREQAETLRAVVEAQQGGSLLGPVQVEFIEGLDIIVLRGNDQDVQRVLQIIDQIERLSEVTVPAIEVYPLEHVDGGSMTRLLNRVYQEVLGPRTGGVSVTTLGRPNELLLIGRPENVRMAIDLIKRLDKPADPTAQFVVFPLKNASAVDAKELLDQFLESEETNQGNQNQQADASEPLLATKAIVVADYRSNSLIVRAAPRDMREINALLERIDTAESASVDEVRVFRLSNARAEELADVLREAITQGGDPGDQEGRSAGLRFVTIDAETQRRLDSGILSNVKISPDVRANTLLVTAPSGSMDLIAALIQQMDRAARGGGGTQGLHDRQRRRRGVGRDAPLAVRLG